MMLLFTSAHCMWCQVLKDMIQTELLDLVYPVRVHEIDVEKQTHIARVFGVLIVPTLISYSRRIAGLPSQTDLRSFILDMIASGPSMECHSASEMIRRAASLQHVSPLRHHLSKVLDDSVHVSDLSVTHKKHHNTTKSDKPDTRLTKKRTSVIA